MNKPKVKVLVIDDSALVRKILKEILESSLDIEVVGTAPDPLVARNKIKQLNPDVLTLDVEMPGMDGITFLKNLMRLRPMPVVMVSTLTERGAGITLEALEVGAVDFIAKPKFDFSHEIHRYTEQIIRKVRVAARAKVKPYKPDTTAVPKRTAPASSIGFSTTDKVIAIGASTGGTEAIRAVLTALPSDSPGILITQHIPPKFSERFAERLDRLCALRVSEARDGEPVVPGRAYIAPGDRHLELTRNGARYVCRLRDGNSVSGHKPSVDVLFKSVARVAGANAMGVILTGMGADGAEGLGDIQRTGAHTIAQDEQTSVVWGMPGEAVKRGNAEKVLPINEIASAIVTGLVA